MRRLDFASGPCGGIKHIRPSEPMEPAYRNLAVGIEVMEAESNIVDDVVEEQSRSRAHEVASRYLSTGNVTGWFDTLDTEAAREPRLIPWADLKPTPNLTAWLDNHDQDAARGTALVMGCGLGDDAEDLAMQEFRVPYKRMLVTRIPTL